MKDCTRISMLPRFDVEDDNDNEVMISRDDSMLDKRHYGSTPPWLGAH